MLDEVLAQSVFAYSEEDNRGGTIRPDGSIHKEHPNVDSFDNYVGRVKINGKEYYVRTTVQHSEKSSTGTHSFMVTDVDVYENTANGLSLPITTRARGTIDGIVDAKLQQFFERASSELLPHDMRERALELSKKLNTPIKVVDNAEEAMDNPSNRHRRAKGWINSKGEIVIVLSNHSDVADIENTAVHEIVGHDGLEAFIGPERMDEFVTEVYCHAGAGIRKKIDARAEREMQNDIDRMTRAKGGDVFAKAVATVEAGQKRRSGHYQREATKEYMADMAGEIGDKGFEKMSQEEQTLWGKIKAKVQKFLDTFLRGLKIAKSIKLTDKDLACILYKAWRHKRGDVFSKAEDAVMRRKSGYDADAQTRLRDGGLGLEEAITKMKAEAVQANSDNLQAKRDAMRAIGGNLNHLRQAMARQREYDLTTVKSITDLAKVLLEANMLDDLSKYEVKRILGAVNNVVGRQDVSQYVQKVMDIMVDNQLRMGANALGKLLTIKGSRVDARGIEVQGALDPEGVAIAKVIRKTTSLPKDEIDNLIADAIDRMSSSDGYAQVRLHSA